MVGGGDYIVGNVERFKDSLPEPSVISNYNQKKEQARNQRMEFPCFGEEQMDIIGPSG